MKKLQFLIVLLFVSLSSFAGYDLLFCTKADSLGNCKGKGETFEWKGDKTTLDLIVMNKNKIGTKKLNFKLFFMKNDKEGTIYADLALPINANALYALKKMYFVKPGYYKVDVMDENDKLLTTSFVTIMDRIE